MREREALPVLDALGHERSLLLGGLVLPGDEAFQLLVQPVEDVHAVLKTVHQFLHDLLDLPIQRAALVQIAVEAHRDVTQAVEQLAGRMGLHAKKLLSRMATLRIGICSRPISAFMRGGISSRAKIWSNSMATMSSMALST